MTTAGAVVGAEAEAGDCCGEADGLGMDGELLGGTGDGLAGEAATGEGEATGEAAGATPGARQRVGSVADVALAA